MNTKHSTIRWAGGIAVLLLSTTAVTGAAARQVDDLHPPAAQEVVCGSPNVGGATGHGDGVTFGLNHPYAE